MNKETPQSISEYMRLQGKKGGKKTAKNHDKEHYREMQRKSVLARLSSKSKAVDK
jgi:general stress protein YciG